MKTLRIAFVAAALSAIAAVAGLPTVSAGDANHKGSSLQATAIPTCAPGTSDCGIYSK